jgi:succinate-semialdehyde dehydrogenase/glutarate-semialdehyde dehydrogenase
MSHAPIHAALAPPPAPPSGTELVRSVRAALLIDGRWHPSASGATFPVTDPATGLELRRVADAAPEDGVSALAAADGARHAWAATAPRDRAEMLMPRGLTSWSAATNSPRS